MSKELTEEQKNKKYPMRLTKFRPGWMDMTPALPVPIIDWIEDKELGLQYGDDEKQTLDIYYPKEKKEHYPTMIIIHGGGWSSMDKSDWHLYPGFFALEQGFAVVSANYRLAPKDKFPAGWEDVNTVIEALIANADDLKIDLKNVFLWGASSGGNFVTMLGLSYAEDPRIRIGGVASLCPVLDIGTQYLKIKDHHFGDVKNKWFIKIIIKFMLKRLVVKYLGYFPDFDKTPIGAYDASFHIGDKVVPFYFQYGYKDPLIISTLVEQFAAVLRKKANKLDDIVTECMHDAPHMGATHHYFDEDKIMNYINFYKKHLVESKYEKKVEPKKEEPVSEEPKKEEAAPEKVEEVKETEKPKKGKGKAAVAEEKKVEEKVSEELKEVKEEKSVETPAEVVKEEPKEEKPEVIEKPVEEKVSEESKEVKEDETAEVPAVESKEESKEETPEVEEKAIEEKPEEKVEEPKKPATKKPAEKKEPEGEKPAEAKKPAAKKTAASTEDKGEVKKETKSSTAKKETPAGETKTTAAKKPAAKSTSTAAKSSSTAAKKPASSTAKKTTSSSSTAKKKTSTTAKKSTSSTAAKKSSTTAKKPAASAAKKKTE
jgi:acetyl esterase/lipase